MACRVEVWIRQLRMPQTNIVPMPAPSLDRILTQAEALPADEQAMLEELLRGRRIETWRRDTAAEARKAIRAFDSSKLKIQPAEKAIALLRAAR